MLNLPQPAPKAQRLVVEASVRNSLELAAWSDRQLTPWARSAAPADLAATQQCSRELANANAPQSQPSVADWDHANAQKWLWGTETDTDSLRFNKKQLVIAATFVAAELEVSRNISFSTIQPHIF